MSEKTELTNNEETKKEFCIVRGLKRVGRLVADNKEKLAAGAAIVLTTIISTAIATKLHISDDEEDVNIFDEPPTETLEESEVEE